MAHPDAGHSVLSFAALEMHVAVGGGGYGDGSAAVGEWGMARSYDWQRHYEAAILATDRSRLPGLIEIAQAAIHVRVEELNLDHAATAEERQAIEDALSGLKVLRKETN